MRQRKIIWEFALFVSAHFSRAVATGRTLTAVFKKSCRPQKKFKKFLKTYPKTLYNFIIMKYNMCIISKSSLLR